MAAESGRDQFLPQVQEIGEGEASEQVGRKSLVHNVTAGMERNKGLETFVSYSVFPACFTFKAILLRLRFCFPIYCNTIVMG